MLYLEALNEKGTIRWWNPDSKVLEFRYTNQFCGSCCFLGRVIESPERGLSLPERELIWEDFSLKRGGSKALYKNALVFFERYLQGQTSIRALHRRVSSSSRQGLRCLVRRLLGKGSSLQRKKQVESRIEAPGDQFQNQEETHDREWSNGNGKSAAELPVLLDLDLKRYAGRNSFDLDLPSESSQQKQGFRLEESAVTDKREKDHKGEDSRAPLLPFGD